MPCASCGRGFHEECLSCKECHGRTDELVETFVKSVTSTGRIKDPEKVTDPQSTGRKRAALVYPLFRDKPCEWRGLENVGGGAKPIVGCIKGLQQARHHGPIKNTLRNEPNNIHRICTTCHNRWHTENDPIYNEEENELLPHDPVAATELNLYANEAAWKLRGTLKEVNDDDR